MKKKYILPVLTLLIWCTFLNGQSTPEEKVMASSQPVPAINSSITGDTITDPASLKDGEILGLEDKDRSIVPEGSKEKKRADKLYRDLGFEASTAVYQSLSRREKRSEKVLSRIANSHRLNHNTEDAEYWYAKFVNTTDEAKHLLHYAQVLQSNGKCEDAIRWYNEYKEIASKKDLKNREFVVHCDEAEFNIHEQVEVNNEAKLNTRHLDFSPVPYGDGVVFTSTRGRDEFMASKDNWTNDNYTDLFYAEFDDEGHFKAPKPFIGEVNGKFHDGTASFNQGQSVMVFTRNNTTGKSKRGLIDLKVYTAHQHNNYWADVEELPFNSNEYSTCHPTMTKDGRKLYFSSNRPGGYGGMDIYVAVAKGGEWSEPQNLGPAVNSSGNEIFPFIGEDETLYFSSNGHKTIGGLDIYKATKRNPADESSWVYRENMGRPFNSEKDDFGFYINGLQTKGYFSSSRKGGQGKDDIYSWKIKKGQLEDEDEKIDRVICVYDAQSNKRIEQADVRIELVGDTADCATNDLLLTLKPIDETKNEYVLGISSPGSATGGAASKKYETDSLGEFTLTQVKRHQVYDVIVEKTGFNTQQLRVDAATLWESDAFCIPLTKRSCIRFDGYVKNKIYDMPMPGAIVTIIDKCTGDKMEMVTNEAGRFDNCLRCGCEYDVLAEKDGFHGDNAFVSAFEIDCDTVASLHATLELVNKSTSLSTSGSDSPKTNLIGDNPPQEVKALKTHFLGNPEAEFVEGQLITLKDVYYDFDQFFIRTDASVDLDRVVRLMKLYPSMAISLESHTDARGTNTYNQQLSQKRAEAARLYIVQQGIVPSRLTAKGFGESRLTNQCRDGIVCTDEAHQVNRRTEIRITKLSEPGVKIRMGE